MKKHPRITLRKKIALGCALGCVLALSLAGTGKAETITFDEIGYNVGDGDPLIKGVQFSAGASPLDTWINDTAPAPTGPYLVNGFDSTEQQTLINAGTDGSFYFNDVAFDVAWEAQLPWPSSTVFAQAYLGGTTVGLASSLASNASLLRLYLAPAEKFDRVYIYDDLNSFLVGDTFHIDNFTFTEWVDNGGNNAVPEPATMMLMATGLAGLAASRRRKSA